MREAWKYFFISFIVPEFSESNVDGFFLFKWGIIITSITSVIDRLVCFGFFSKKEGRMQKFYSSLFCFSICVFFERGWQVTGRQRMGKDYLYSSLPFTPGINLQFSIWDGYLIRLIAAHVIPDPYLNVNFVLLVDFMSDLIKVIFHRHAVIWISIDYHPITRNKTTNQVN